MSSYFKSYVESKKCLESLYKTSTLFFMFLILCGDIESNPGPYRFLKCIQGSFHQGHHKFGVTRGIQCTCIALYGVCFSVFKPIYCWNKNNLDCILEKGDALYKIQDTTTYLPCTYLPRIVTLGHNVQVEFLSNSFGFIHKSGSSTRP